MTLAKADRIAAAASVLGSLARLDAPLGELTTYRVGGTAAIGVTAGSLDDLQRVAIAVQVAALPVLVVGRGSNLLVADRGFLGIAVTLGGEAFGSLAFDGAFDVALDVAGGAGPLVEAGGAVHLPVLARQTAAAGLTGLEWAVGVPGSVGGAVRMNAGGHGSDISQVLHSCRRFDLNDGSVADVALAQLDFGYRHSAVERHHVVLSASLRVARGDREASEVAIRDIVHWRREHQPGGQNAGSVFTNPPGVPPRNSAGWLVEAAGLKGYRLGTASVSDKHGNFIQADPAGSADDVVALMLDVQRLVGERLGVALRAEVKLVGFEEAQVELLRTGVPA